MSRVIVIFNAAKAILIRGQIIFSRSDVRKQLEVSPHDWDMGYTAIFQGMIENCPEKSNKVLSVYRGVFKRIEHGRYSFTDYGKSMFDR
jgi:hypothetical protein